MPTVIFESDSLLVIDKPAGLIVHSDGRTEEPSVADWLLENYPALAEVGEPWTSPQGEIIPLPGIVHRLDRTTSGVMLIAKKNEMYTYLKQLFKERKIEKTYVAWVHGHMDPSSSSGQARSGQVVAEIVRTSEPPKRWSARPTDEQDCRAAITKWEVLKQITDPESGKKLSYMIVKPLTGRTHQIRVHLASIGHPIVGDRLYGPADRVTNEEVLRSAGRTRLHAHTISFPLDGKVRVFTSQLPADFEQVQMK